MQTVYGNVEKTFSPLKVYIHIFLKNMSWALFIYRYDMKSLYEALNFANYMSYKQIYTERSLN